MGMTFGLFIPAFVLILYLSDSYTKQG